MAAVLLALTIAAPAWASSVATATLAPIGTGSYLLTLTNTSSQTITGFVVAAGSEPSATNIVPSPACSLGTNNTPILIEDAVICNVAVAPGASTRVCYTGHAPSSLVTGAGQVLLLGTTASNIGELFATIPGLSPAVTSCPLPGFKSGASGAGGATKCVVPNLKGKKLVAAEKAITQAHCAVGKVKKTGSSHVKKGSVISQSPGAGKSLSEGTKVSLVVSKGK